MQSRIKSKGHTKAAPNSTLGAGFVKCWGDFYDSSSVVSGTRVQVSGLTTATAVSVGGYFACALDSDGTVQCWGENSSGNLGNEDADSLFSETPVTVTSSS
jgi:hypothetical protein